MYFFSTQNFVHEFMRDILSLYCIVYTTILCSQLCKIANVNLIKGPGTPLFLNLNLCDRNFLIMHWLFFVFDSIDKYRIDSDRIIFKILRKKNLLFWIFPLWISSFTRKKNKRKFVRFFFTLPIFVHTLSPQAFTYHTDMQLFINSNFLLKGLKQNLY